MNATPASATKMITNSHNNSNILNKIKKMSFKTIIIAASTTITQCHGIHKITTTRTLNNSPHSSIIIKIIISTICLNFHLNIHNNSNALNNKKIIFRTTTPVHLIRVLTKKRINKIHMMKNFFIKK